MTTTPKGINTMTYKHTFNDGTEFEVEDLRLSSKEMRALRKQDELNIMYDLLEKKLTEGQLEAIETDKDGEDRDFNETTAFFSGWFDAAVSGK